MHIQSHLYVYTHTYTYTEILLPLQSDMHTSCNPLKLFFSERQRLPEIPGIFQLKINQKGLIHEESKSKGIRNRALF